MTYETSAHMVSPQGDITAAKIGLTFAKDSQDVKTLEASGTVTLKEMAAAPRATSLSFSQGATSYPLPYSNPTLAADLPVEVYVCSVCTSSAPTPAT